MAIAEIREFLAPLPDGALIASRQLLHLARNRSAIDMAMSRLNAKTIALGDTIFSEFKGALAEQYVF